MPALPHCPACNSEYTYEDGGNYVCPGCAHEWPVIAAAAVVKVGADAEVILFSPQHEHGEVIDHMLHKMAG